METGAERVLREVPPQLRGARVGLLTHAGAVDAGGVATVDAFAAAPDLRLVRLFAPEHGLRGERAAGEGIDDGVDDATGLPVSSLYPQRQSAGANSPDPDPVAGLDAVLADLQDIGCRYFTLAGTLAGLARRTASAGVPLWVCDRPNPLGAAVAGPTSVPARLRSLVAAFDVPVRHGLTIGELALVAARQGGLPEGSVRVLPVRGWRRADGFAAWNRAWVPPSPNATGPEMAELYPGTCLFEGTNLSEGRGTPYPFRQVGAPWLDAADLARRVRGRLPPGVHARASTFRPTASKHAGQVCQGVFFDLDPAAAATRPPDAALAAALAVMEAASESPRFEILARGVPWLDRLTGGDALREAIGRPGAVADLLAVWRGEAGAFARPFDLYPA